VELRKNPTRELFDKRKKILDTFKLKLNHENFDSFGEFLAALIGHYRQIQKDNEFIEGKPKRFLIAFDDAAYLKILNDRHGKFIAQLLRIRHVNTSIYLAAQAWRTFLTAIRNNATTIVLFPGMNKEQISVMKVEGTFSDFFDKDKITGKSLYDERSWVDHEYVTIDLLNRRIMDRNTSRVIFRFLRAFLKSASGFC